MRRFTYVIPIVTMMILGLVAGSWSVTETAAQEATPEGGDFLPEGATFESVAYAAGIEMPSTGDLNVFRLALEPGVSIPIEEDDPTSGLLIVESGEFTVSSDAVMTVTRAGVLDEAMAAAMEGDAYAPELEEIAAGEEVTLAAGDAAFIPANVAGELRNDGDEPAVGLGVLVGPPEEDM